LLAERGARTVVTSLYYSHARAELALVPAALQLGLVLDPSTHLREVELEHRSPVFRAHGFGAGERFDPETSAISERELLALATDPIDLQRSGGGTLMLTSYHVAGPAGTRGRELELLLARAGIAHFRAERMDEPPEHAEVAVRREIFATLAVRVGDLLDGVRREELVRAYLALDGDGIWLKVLGLHEGASTAEVGAGAALLRELAEGPVPVVSDGAGQLHLAALASGISASIGIGDSERFRHPSDWRQPSVEGKGAGRVRTAYHPALMRGFKVNSQNARDAFARLRCRCGQHPPREPPGNARVGAHAAVVRMRQSDEALDGGFQERREWLRAAAVKATWVADDAGLPPTAAPAAFDAFFEGWDGGSERRRAVDG